MDSQTDVRFAWSVIFQAQRTHPFYAGDNPSHFEQTTATAALARDVSPRRDVDFGLMHQPQEFGFSNTVLEHKAVLDTAPKPQLEKCVCSCLI